MKLNKLRLENFRWHRTLEILDIPKILLVLGRNARGKTSILEGITWNLAGATRHTSIDGKYADILVMDGEAQSLVETDVQTASGVHNIKRSIPHTLSVDNSTGG